MRKALLIFKAVLTWSILLFAVGMMIFTLVSVNTLDRNDRGILGFKFFIVQSDSMAATDFEAGDIVISREVDVTTLKEGDIITFVSQGPQNSGETVTHKIRRVTTDADGDIAFVTYGTTTGKDDDALATIIVGKYAGRLPRLGTFFQYLKTTPGYILCVFIPFLLLILSQGVTCIRLFRQYKREQMDEMVAERAKIEEERAESRRMMAELLELKAQLAKKEEGEASPTSQGTDDGESDEI